MNEIILALVKNRKPYLEIEQFSGKPGIYALFFNGKDFPLQAYSPKPNDIIYIGKTESSQASRDRDTHFASGKTGSSTLRKSFGSMLRTKYNLKPVPRGQVDIDKQRTSHFKFDALSEEKLTEWMKHNLSLAFHEYSGSATELNQLESYLINQAKPVLNIDHKNAENPYKSAIRALRREAGLIAYNTTAAKAMQKVKSQKLRSTNVTLSKTVNGGAGKYEHIWEQLIPSIIQALNVGTSTDINIGLSPFKAVGNRKSYTFRLELQNGSVVNNVAGSAVARDLARVLLNNAEFLKALKSKNLVLRLDKQFTLNIRVN